MKIASHRELVVWQKAMDLVVLIYRRSSRFPPDERYRLTSQITRVAASVPANIAEVHARSTAKDYAHFLSVAKGSLMETETFLMLAPRLDYVSEDQAAPALNPVTQVSKMLTAIRTRLACRVSALFPVSCNL